jgi:glycosyltransferase involved in cell wall biosynthesis
MSSQKTIRISAYFRHHKINPSNYYRFYQYIKDLPGKYYLRDTAPEGLYIKSLNSKSRILRKIIQGSLFIIINLRLCIYLISDCINRKNIIFIQRELSPRFILRINLLLLKVVSRKSRVIWDFDDDIINNGEISERELAVLERISKHIIVIGDYLRNLLPEEVHSKVVCIPTTDGDIFGHIDETVVQQRLEKFKTSIDLVWMGTNGNLKNLDKIIPALDKAAEELAQDGKRLGFRCISGVEYKFNTKKLIIENVKWSRKNAIEALKQSHIGIMPLPHNQFSLGKGGFKLIQYLSAKLPVIASDVGFNGNIVDGNNGILVDDSDDNDCWIKAVLKMSRCDYSILSETAFKSYETKYHYKNNLDNLINLLKDNNE